MNTPAACLARDWSSPVALYQGHCLSVLKTLPSSSIDCCVSSPPYWGLRDYGTEPLVWDGDSSCCHRWESHLRPTQNGQTAASMRGETKNRYSATRRPQRSAFCTRCDAWRGSLGLEPTPALYVDHLVTVFREVRRVLRDDGTLWLVVGDCYAGSWGNYHPGHSDIAPGQRPKRTERWNRPAYTDRTFLPPSATAPGLKRKDLVGIAWLLAFALRADGWCLRSDIIWQKRNPIPESVRDRPTRAHEYIFLLAKSPRYYYDAAAIAEPLAESSLRRLRQSGFSSKPVGVKIMDRQPTQTVRLGALWLTCDGASCVRNGRRWFESAAARRAMCPMGVLSPSSFSATSFAVRSSAAISAPCGR